MRGQVVCLVLLRFLDQFRELSLAGCWQDIWEDQMLGIVCKNYAAADSLETFLLHELGKSPSGRSSFLPGRHKGKDSWFPLYSSLPQSYLAEWKCTPRVFGAISLDGGIMCGNGLLSIGNWDSNIPDIIFPVKNKNTMTPQSVLAMEQLEAEKLVLAAMNRRIDEQAISYQEQPENFRGSQERYNNYLASQGEFATPCNFIDISE